VRIGRALPEIFERSYPVILPNTDMLMAASLLRFHQIDALPFEFKMRQKKRSAVFGYSCLSTLLKTEPENYGNFLKLPAKKAALELATISVESGISDLLRLFQNTRFGFAWVESEKLGGFASLRDLLGLYSDSIIESNLKLKDLASPIFSLPKGTAVKKVLDEMFSRRIRRIFVDGKRSLITDRRIISHLFSPSRVEEASKDPKLLMEAKLGDIEFFEPPMVKGSFTVKKGASLMQNQTDECLLCEQGVLTPWDLIMKPLARGALRIKE
jgi:CBS domain-containing protein